MRPGPTETKMIMYLT